MATWQLRAWVIPERSCAGLDGPAIAEGIREGTLNPWADTPPGWAAGRAEVLGLAPGRSWDPEALLWGTDDGSYLVTSSGGRRPESVEIGIDARVVSRDYCLLLARFLGDLGARLVTTDGRAVGSSEDEIVLAIRSSRAWRFVSDPRRFLDALPRVDFEGLRERMTQLTKVVLDWLPAADQLEITGLIEANEFEVALEWLLDSLVETKGPLPRPVLDLIDQLGKEMAIEASVRDRLRPALVGRAPANHLDKFDQWIDRASDRLARNGFIDVHVDEILSAPERADWVRIMVDLFRDIVRARADRLSGMVLMLIIPLPSTSSARRSPPSWEEVVAERNSAPPSLYVLLQRTRDLAWNVERFVTLVKSPLEPDFVAHLVSWRRPEDPAEEGWQQDVRIEHAFS